MTGAERPLGLASTLGYASGSLATGIINTISALLLLYFATEILRLPAAVAATIILLPKLWIIAWDPLVGAWSDRVWTGWGRRLPFMAAGAVLTIAGFVGLFSPPALSYPALIGWVSLAYFGVMSGFSLFAVPYLAIPTEISGGGIARARLVRWRMVFAMVGTLVSAAGAPMLVRWGGGGREGYALMAVVIGFVCLIAMLGPMLMAAKAPMPRPGPKDGRDPALLTQIAAALRDPPFREMAFAHTLQVAAVGALTAGLPYLVTRGLDRPPSDVGIALLTYLLPTAAAIPLWGIVGQRVGEGIAQALAGVVYAAGAALLGGAVLADAGWGAALLMMPLLGIGFAGMQGQSFVIITRVIHRAAQGRAGAVFTGVWTASERLGLAIGPALTGVALAIWGGTLAMWIAVATPALVLASLPALLHATRREYGARRAAAHTPLSAPDPA